jgi:hypothetical protein
MRIDRRTLLHWLGLGALVCGMPKALYAAEAPWIGKAQGRPRIRVDRVRLPPNVAGAAGYAKKLRRVLLREARRADWGAGAGSSIVFRFTVERLELEQQGKLLQVHCSAIGELPKGRTARSQLRFGGHAAEGERLVFKVLEIVARGVVTRLADLERARRTR